MIRIIAREISLGRFRVGLNSIVKVMLAMVLAAAASAANAITLILDSHNQTSSSGAISTLITDGSHVEGQPASTAVWDWDGTSLTATGLFSTVSSINSSTITPTVLNDQITDLAIDTSTSTASATAYICAEGTFLAGVGASGCGGHNLGANFINESNTTWGPGLAVSQTIGGDDVLTAGAPRDITAYDFGNVADTGTGLGPNPGDQLMVGNDIAVGVPDGELLTFTMQRSVTDDAVTTAPGQAVDISVLVNDAIDDDIISLTTTVPTDGTAAVIGTPGPRTGLFVEYTPPPGFVTGTATFEFDYTVEDQDGSLTATVAVTVTDEFNANNDGTQTSPFMTVIANQTESLDVLANDTGLIDPALTVQSPVNTTPALGTATVVGSPGGAGAIHIDYTAGSTIGIDSFDYQVSDTGTGVDNATVFVEVVPLNIPVAVDDIGAIFFDEDGLPFDDGAGFVDVLANDTGRGDDPLIVTITGNPAHGFIHSIQGCEQQGFCKIWYVPEAGFFGDDSFQYQVTDDTPETSNTANVAIAVSPSQPVAVDDSAATLEDEAVTIDILENDTDLTDPVTVTILTAPANGSVSINGMSPGNAADIDVTYTPTAGAAVTADTFTYRLTDDNGTSTADVAITITLNQNKVPGSSSAVGPVGLGMLMLLPLLRFRRRSS